ncbi:MAG TPA: hypothetical protein VN428_13040 [Bryobacteraceae bacterium]|nr:hypothetical protein [Bryobacteraceae bacterium]
MQSGQRWGEAESAARQSGVPEDQIRLQLERILASPEFRASRRCQDVLRFIVRMTLEGRASEIKERTIGLEVLGRPSSYDPSVDSTVRVKTGDIRRRLSLYYANPAPEDRVMIELPAGSYVPTFRTLPGIPQQAHQGAASPEPTLRPWWAVAGLALLLAGAAIAFWTARIQPEPALREFWGPALKSGVPALVCMSYVPVYWLKPSVEAAGRNPSGPDDFVLRNDQFIGGADSVAAFTLESAMRRLGGASVIKVGSGVTFHDLQSSPSILIGYSYTRWNVLNNELRFRIDTSSWRKGITDRGKPTAWVLPQNSDGAGAQEDYAVIARTFHPDTGNMLVLLAGVEGFGTQAAADLVTQEQLLAEALRDAPPDWARKNVELVLHVKVISGAAGTPRVVARHFW